MKRKALWWMVFFSIFIFSIRCGYANTADRIEIKNATTDIKNGIIYIYGLNFGDSPIVVVDGKFLEVETSNETYIQALLPRDIALKPGVHHLVVAKDLYGFYYYFKYFNYTGRTDILDISISAREPQEIQSLPEVERDDKEIKKPSGSEIPSSQIGNMTFYEKHKTILLQPTKIETVSCACDENDIMWTGGYFIEDINSTTLRYLISIMKSYPTYSMYGPRGWAARVANTTISDTVTVTVRVLCLDVKKKYGKS